MGRLVAPLLLILIALLTWLPVETPTGDERLSAAVEHHFGEGRLEEREGLRILHLKGAPYEIGYQHGVLLGHEIRSGLRKQLYEELILEGGIPHVLLVRYARHIDSYLPSEYREEIRGLSDGAGVSYSDVLLLQSFQDLLSQPSLKHATQDLLLTLSPPYVPRSGSVSVLPSTGSSSENPSSARVLSLPLEAAFAAFGETTQDRKLLQGLEFASSQLRFEDLLLIVYQPQVGNRFVSLAWPGAVGVTIGLNEEKISVAELASPSYDASVDGTPLPFLLRDVLEYAGDIPTALRLLSSARRTGGHNVIIGDGKPADAQAMEFSAHQYALFEAEHDFILRCNHYLDPALAETQQISSQGEYASSQERFEAIRERLDANHGRLDLSAAISVLVDSHTGTQGNQENVLGLVIASSDLQVCAYASGRMAARCVKLDVDL